MNVLDEIGHTPLVRLERLSAKLGAQVWLKDETRNPTGSVKDRVACHCIRMAKDRGDITGKKAVIEACSGTLGVSLAMTCAALPNTDSEPTEGQEGYRFVSFQLYDALVKWDASSETEAGKIIPGLATSWEQNPENPKRWTFHLREGVKFHDGTDFNADCVIFALDRVMNPDFEYYSTTCAASVGSFLANIESYAKVDDYTITIDTVQDNNAYLIYDLPYIMIPSMEAVKEKGDGFADAPVGSGPFRFVSKIAGQELVMERNENYWGNVPQIKTLILKPISDASARLAALQSGEVDWAEVVPVESLESLKSQGYQVKLNDYPHAWLYIMNTESGPFADARVRQAFSMSINREGLCNDILQGVGTPLAQLMYPGSPWYAEGVEEYTYNPERAKELLAEAGYRPYYMYRQKGTLQNLENIGWAKPGFECLYNIYIMEEVHTILSAGAGGSTKLVIPGQRRGKIERIFNFKYPTEYIDRFAELLDRKKAVEDFYARYTSQTLHQP